MIGRRCCITGFDVGSLLSLIVYLFAMRSAWYLIGGIEASILRALVGVVLKAVQMSFNVLHWTFLEVLVMPHRFQWIPVE